MLPSMLNADGLARFHQEMRLASSMRHQNILTVFTSGMQDGVPFMVMEYLQGHDLTRMPVGWGAVEIAGAGRDTCLALSYAHSLDVVHRDIKPGNLFACDTGLVKVTDFGIAKALTPLKAAKPGTVIGTPLYMAPEQWLGRPATSAIDIWLTGCVLYELLTGRPPRRFETTEDYLAAAARGDRVPSIRNAADVPSWLADAIMPMLDPDPANRPAASECTKMLDGPPGLAVALPKPGPAAAPRLARVPASAPVSSALADKGRVKALNSARPPLEGHLSGSGWNLAFTWRGQPVDLQPLKSGEHSNAYRFETAAGSKVLRVNSVTDYGFCKDAYAAGQFNSSTFPVPAVDEISQSQDGRYYAVSKWRPGRGIHDIDPGARARIAPAVVSITQGMARARAGIAGYGWWNGTSKTSEYSDWRAAMMKLANIPYGSDLKNVPKPVKSLMLTASNLSKRLLNQFCPKYAHSVVHGDLSGNMLFGADGVTAVIDWSHSMFGDRVYDIAELDAHLSSGEGSPDYAQVFRDAYRARGALPKHFKQRLLCYQMLLTISDLSYYLLAGRSTDSKERKLESYVARAATALDS